ACAGCAAASSRTTSRSGQLRSSARSPPCPPQETSDPPAPPPRGARRARRGPRPPPAARRARLRRHARPDRRPPARRATVARVRDRDRTDLLRPRRAPRSRLGARARGARQVTGPVPEGTWLVGAHGAERGRIHEGQYLLEPFELDEAARAVQD